jgi:tape measure domain-containing protein
MSTTIDQRVVEMRFDNKHFENNVSTTMSTLDKLKQKLNLDGAAKGLENVNAAAKNVNMSGLGSAVETVQAKFSAMQVVGVTALANLTNSAVNAGKRIVSALTIDPIKTGFQEYETQINATQTILANTQSKGSTIDDVNRALKELNGYADMTIYNFTEMTRNIGTFTAAGIELDTSVNAIQGIANLAAVSGSTSQQASTAMYQLSQALAAGTVKLMDWNSVVNAGMGGEMFQNALKKTSEELGTGAEAAIKASGSFRESLKDGWLTADVLTATLKKFTTSGANEYVAEYIGQSPDVVESALEEGEAAAKAAGAIDEEAFAIEHASKALAEKYGKNEDEIKQSLEFARNATDAATKVKTFTQLWDVLKESAQSGWAQTWKILVGDFEEAKNLLTPLSDILTGFIGKMNDWRNNILEGALGRGFGKLSESFTTLLKPATAAIDAVKSVTDNLKSLDEIADEVISGSWGNWTDRFNALSDAGYNYCEVQNKVNEKLGDGYRYTEEQIEAQNKLIGTQVKTTEQTDEQAEATAELTEKDKNLIKELAMMDEAQIRSKVKSEEQIQALKDLGEQADKLGIPLDEFIDNLDQINGRWLLINSFKNIGQGIVSVFNAIKDAWQDVFPPKSIEERSEQLFNIIAAVHKFTMQLRGNEETADKLRRTFAGVFAIIDMIATITGGALRIAFKVVQGILSYFDMDILDLTATIGDAISGFHDWIENLFSLSDILDVVVPIIVSTANAISRLTGRIKESDTFKSFASYLKEAKESLLGWFKGLDGASILDKFIGYIMKIRDTIYIWLTSPMDTNSVAGNIIAGLVNGLRSGVTAVWNAALAIGKAVLDSVKAFLGIHSPSTEFEEVGGNVTDGFILGIKNGSSGIWDTIKGLFSKVVQWVKSVDFGTILAGTVAVGAVGAVRKIGNILELFAQPFASLGDVMEGVGDVLKKSAKPIKKILNNTAQVVKGFSKVLKAEAFKTRTDGIKNLAVTLLMLVGAIIVLTYFNPTELLKAVGIVFILAAVLVGLAWATDKISNASVSIKDGINVRGLSTGLLGIGAAILLVAAAVKMLSGLEPEQAKTGFIGLAAVIGALGILIAAFGILVKGKSAQNIDKFGATMLKLSMALLLMIAVVKLASKLTMDELETAGIFVAGFLAFVTIIGLIAMLPVGKSIDKLGGMMVKMSIALMLMVAVVKLAAGLSMEELKTGAIFLAGFVVFVGILAAIGGLGGKSIDGVGKMMLSLSISMLLLIGVIKLIGMLEPDEMAKGLAAIIIFATIIGVFVKTVMKQGSQAPKVALTILAFSIAIGILAAIAIVCSLISVEGLVKGIAAVSMLSVMMALMIASTRGANNVTGNIVAMSVAIAVMVAAVALLTMIDTTKLAIATGVLSVLMRMFALMTKASGSTQKAMGTIIALTVAVAAIGGVLYLLSTMPIESTIGSAVALTIVLAAVTGALYLLVPIGKVAADALYGVVALTAMVIPLLAFVGVLALMQNVQGALKNTIALTILATALTAMLIPLSVVGALAFASGGATMLGIVALTAMAVPLAAFVGILALMQNIEGAIKNALVLTTLMGAMSSLMIVLAYTGPLAMVGVTALTALTGLMVGIGGLVVAIGALVTKFPQLEQFVGTGIGLLEQLASGLGSVIGSFISGFAGEVMSILPPLGQSLSQFMVNVMPFINGAKMVDESVLSGVGILSASILALTAANLISGITNFLPFVSSFADLGTQLSQFMINATPFIMGASMLNESMTSGIKTLAEAILILTAANVIDGLTSLFTGEGALDNFANQLPILGAGLQGFAANIGTFAEDQVATVTCAANAIKILAQAANEIPNTGGLLAQLVGENDLGVFAAQFPILGSGLSYFLANIGTFTEDQVATVNCAAEAIKTLASAASEIPNAGGLLADLVGDNELGTFAAQFPILGAGLRAFLTNIGTFTEDQVATVTCAANAIKALAEASSEIPNTGGLLAQIVGDNELGTFASQFPVLGTGISNFLTNIGTFTDDQVATVTCAANAIKALAGASSSIPNAGGLLAQIVGDNELGTFAKQLPNVGEGIKGFVEKLGTFTSEQVSSVYSAVAAINALAGLAGTDLKNAKKYIDDFGDKLPGFASDVSDFCTNMPSGPDMTTAVTNINKLLGAIESIGNANSGVLSTFADNLKKIGKNAVNKFVEAFESTTVANDLESAAEDLGQKVVDGIESKEDSIESAGESAAKKAVDGIETQEDDMETAGKDLGSGLVRGINAKKTAVYNAAYALGQKAVQGEKDGQKSNSPSKLTILAGEWLGEGLIVGMKNIGKSVYKAGDNLGSSATKSVSSTISNIAALVNSDIESQPTIRPVVDLSEVKTGVNAIGNMLNFGSSIGVRANVGAISSMMNSRGQNGANDDVISAINKLGKGLSNVGGTTYQINGVTYDDGSNVRTAIEEIARYAIMDRRS